jgi:hypothetical protein
MYPWVKHTGFYGANLKESNPLVDLDTEGRISKWILNKYSEKAWTALIWLSIVTNDGLL